MFNVFRDRRMTRGNAQVIEISLEIVVCPFSSQAAGNRGEYVIGSKGVSVRARDSRWTDCSGGKMKGIHVDNRFR